MYSNSTQYNEINSKLLNIISVYSKDAEQEVSTHYKTQLDHSVYILTHIYDLLWILNTHENQDEITDAAFNSQMLIWQASSTMLGALQLLRQGYNMEPKYLMRVSVESLALAIQIKLDKDAYVKYQNNKLDGRKCITFSKVIINEIGQIYGRLSGVIHPSISTIGYLYNTDRKTLIMGGSYNGGHDKLLLMNFSILNLLLLNIWKATEYLFFDFSINSMLWEQTHKDLVFKPNLEVRELFSHIMQDFKVALEDITET